MAMESPRPATLQEIGKPATWLQAKGLIEQAFGGGYVATPDGVKSFCGECETEKRKAQWPNGGRGTQAVTGCPFAERCQVRRIGQQPN